MDGWYYKYVWNQTGTIFSLNRLFNESTPEKKFGYCRFENRQLPFKLLLLYVETKKIATLSEKNVGFPVRETVKEALKGSF